MKKLYILKSKVDGSFNGKNGGRTTNLKEAALFSAKQVIQHADMFSSNFEFVEIVVVNKGGLTTRNLLVGY